MKQLSDNDLFPFGKYKNEPMWKVPGTYYDWLIDQPWVKSWPEVEDYIMHNKNVIDKEVKDSGVLDD